MRRTNQNQGFTIVEMLTVMGIIAILIGLLIPALNQVKDYSRQIQQKAQFHSIDPALEMYKNDFGTYPESNDNLDIYITDGSMDDTYDNTPYCGANKLAETLVGLDFLGMHPKTEFHADGYADYNGDNDKELIYDPVNGVVDNSTTLQDNDENITCRKKYINLENANAFQMQDIWDDVTWTTGTTQNGSTFRGTSIVVCDVYSKKRYSGKKTGMPVLYFRARTSYQFQDYTDTSKVTMTLSNDIYYLYDNVNLLALNSPEDNTIEHPLWDKQDSTDYEDFEDMILNKQVQTATKELLDDDAGVKRPYREDSYILLSAGKDGLYGTADDILNFDKSADQ